MRPAAEYRALLDAANAESNQLDQQINELKRKQAEVNVRRNTLEKQFQEADAAEAQAKTHGG